MGNRRPSYLVLTLVILIVSLGGIFYPRFLGNVGNARVHKVATTLPNNTKNDQSKNNVSVGITKTSNNSSAVKNLSLKDPAKSKFVVKHVILIMLENKNWSYLLNNSSPDPYIRNVLIPNYSTSEDYFGITHPSLPNYIAIIAGSFMNVKNNTIAEGSLASTNLVDLMSAHNITWKAYMESMPASNTLWCSNGFLNSNDPGDGPGYVTKLNPFIFFSDIISNYSRCENIIPLTQLNEDLANNQLPQFSFITPNVTDNGHTVPADNVTTCPPSGTRLQCTDKWLRGFMPEIINSKEFANSVIFIVWDAAKPNNAPNHTIMIMVSPDAKQGFIENTILYTHYSVLATIEKIYSLGTLGRNDNTANLTSDMFVANTIP